MKVTEALFLNEVPITVTLPNGSRRVGAKGFREGSVLCELVSDKLWFVESADRVVVVPVSQVVYMITEEMEK